MRTATKLAIVALSLVITPLFAAARVSVQGDPALAESAASANITSAQSGQFLMASLKASYGPNSGDHNKAFKEDKQDKQGKRGIHGAEMGSGALLLAGVLALSSYLFIAYRQRRRMRS